jgi:hypothetical protein
MYICITVANIINKGSQNSIKGFGKVQILLFNRIFPVIIRGPKYLA